MLNPFTLANMRLRTITTLMLPLILCVSCSQPDSDQLSDQDLDQIEEYQPVVDQAEVETKEPLEDIKIATKDIKTSSPSLQDDATDSNSEQLRADCAMNLKQLALVVKMYANESVGGIYPRPVKLSINRDAVWPEYITDTSVLVCPAEGNDPPKNLSDTDKTQWYFDNSDYWYIAHALINEDQGQAYIKAVQTVLQEGNGNLNVDFDAPNTLLKKIFRIREGIERYFITDINNPSTSSNIAATIPVLIERPGHHGSTGGNVLFMDGHVEYINYPGKFPMTKAFIEGLESLEALGEKNP